MRIKEFKVWSSDLGNVRPYTIAFKTVDEVRNAFVEVTLENGITGIGSGNPSEFVVGENLDQCVEALGEKNLGFLYGRDIRELHQLTFEIARNLPNNPSARAALEIALYDAFTKQLGIPLVSYLGQKMKSLPTSNTIGIKSVDETVEQAKEYIEKGFSILKIKLGKNIQEDVERLVKLREAIGKGITIRVDANQAYTFKETIQFYHDTKNLNLELIEQPLPAKATAEMRKLPEEIKAIMAADESLLSPSDALELIKPPGAVGIFNIKLMKCGGITPAMHIAHIAQYGSVELFWGCNDESIISITAALHAAFACPHTKYIDLDGSLDLGRDVVKGGFILKSGRMYCSEKPGLGVERI